MKRKSVFSLISLCKLDEKSNSLLNERCQTYIDKQKKAIKEKLPQEINDLFIASFEEMLEGDGDLLMHFIDAFDDEMYIGYFIDMNPLKKNASLSDINNQKGIEYILKNARTICAITFSLFLTGFIQKEKMIPSLKETLRAYINHKMFALHIVDKVSSDEEYPYEYHKAYYELYGKNGLNRVDFYFDFVSYVHNSIFYNVSKKKREFVSYEVYGENAELTPKLKEQFISLLTKYNTELYEYEEVENCISEFDDFFRKNVNPKVLHDTFLEYLRDNFDLCENISHLIMTLLTRTHTPQGFKFAITSTRIFNYMKENERLYRFLENMTLIDDLCQYAIYALQSHTRFQKICLKLAKKNRGIPLCQIIMYMDINLKKTREFVFEILNKPFVRQACGLALIDKYYTPELFDDPGLDEDDVRFFVNIVLGAVTNNKFGEFTDLDNYKSIIKTIYNKCYEKYHYLFHYLSAAILTYFDNHKKIDFDTKEEIKSFILDIVNYEEEVAYIDDCLANDNFDPFEISCMIESYSYYPEYLILSAYNKNPIKCIRFLTHIIDNTEDDDLIHECMLLLDREYNVDPAKLDVKSSELYKDVRDDDAEECVDLMMIADALQQVNEYYPNLYNIGINYYASFIRLLFYRSLDELNENYMIEDMTLFEQIEINLLYETYESIIKLMNKILGLDKITAS